MSAFVQVETMATIKTNRQRSAMKGTSCTATLAKAISQHEAASCREDHAIGLFEDRQY